MDERKCSECRHFLQHYSLNKGKMFRVYCGHCVCSRAKRKHPDTRACEKFDPAPADEEAFVTKEYLTKELLSYVLGLELLPEIGEMPDPSKEGHRRG